MRLFDRQAGRKDVKISNLETRLYRIPLPSPMTDAVHGEMTHFEVVMVLLETQDGTRGLGYTYTIGQGGAAIRSLLEEVIRPILLQADPGRIEALWEKMWWQLHYIGRGGLASFAISAADIALWDLAGRRLATPLWRLLGGFSGQVRPYAGGIDLHLDLDGLLAHTQQRLDQGFTAIKMKVGRPRLQDDVARIKAVRALVEDDTPLMVDANMRWDVSTAIRAARKFRPYDVYWLEEPIVPDDISGHARIAREGGVPLASGENVYTPYEFQQLIQHGQIAFPEPDVSKVGGITNWMRVARLAYAHNLPVTSHGVHELHLHLLAAIPNASFLEVHGFGLERFMLQPPVLDHGMMKAPETPGHGVAFDWQALAEFGGPD